MVRECDATLREGEGEGEGNDEGEIDGEVRVRVRDMVHEGEAYGGEGVTVNVMSVQGCGAASQSNDSSPLPHQ